MVELLISFSSFNIQYSNIDHKAASGTIRTSRPVPPRAFKVLLKTPYFVF